MSNGHKGGIDAGQCAQGSEEAGLLWDRPAGESLATLILAHGAGAPMDSDFMNLMAVKLAARGLTVVRFEFDYMAARRQDGKKRPPNPQAKLLERWREVHAAVRQQVTGPLAIGGKSMGGRMASLLADELGADGLICLGYPFHAIGKADKPRTAHLADLKTPTLIVQGERDAMGDRHTVASYQLSRAIELCWLTAGDHDLKPLKVSGYSHEQHLESAADAVAAFLTQQGDAGR
ncbi:alpha/beta hydrolase [Pseudomonas daroniae]|uniref:Alpha/beta hydrolase n=1 Tax=Phytopseudomonas daroniae TaxID=2487519 RepID=A0A4Q9QFQ6_9GAMM|nr:MULTISPECIES: alpha/beta family hydrolase [Pseudomonas]TBU72029.1 alpha/beta hydrolase [Pseudomonas daroniae]TBU75872.1 alpha/beta hydrolase [Pseudomonas sp. FRB 228]TBU87148.1 alpha/beta hydrolase [Pseudomonas daroniae]